MPKEKKLEDEEAKDMMEPEPQVAPEAKAELKAVKAVARKAHWPKDFVPSGDLVADTKAILEGGAKTHFMVPMSPGDMPGAEEIVQINGYKLTIKKGAMVEIPVSMAELLANKYKVELVTANGSLAAKSQEARDALDA